MTSQERLMYQILGSISNTDTPLVFKGALIVKLLLAEHGYTMIERATKDIDANWIGTPPTNDVLVETINNALKEYNNDLYAELRREYSKDRTARIVIIDTNTKDELVSMDININPVIGNRVYYYGGVKIKGVLPNEILADKINVLSGTKIFRRMKDFIDVYALSHCVKVETSEIFDFCNKKGYKLGNFNEVYNKVDGKDGIKHAYSKWKGVEGKPDFDVIYSYMSKFLYPFAERNVTNGVWNNNTLTWINKQKNKINNYLL